MSVNKMKKGMKAIVILAEHLDSELFAIASLQMRYDMRSQFLILFTLRESRWHPISCVAKGSQ